MAFVPPRDRVFEHSISAGPSVFTVTGAVDTSYNAFSSSMSIGDTTLGGVVEPGVAFKSGVLTYSNTNEITVSTVLESKGTFTSTGTKEVFMGLPALSVSGDVSSTSTGALKVTGINGVDQTAAWTTYTPAITSGTGTITTSSATGRYRQIGKTIHLQVDIVITTAGTGASILIATLPVNSFAGKGYSGIGRERLLTNTTCIGSIVTTDATKLNIIPIAGGTIIASGNAVTVSITYEAA